MAEGVFTHTISSLNLTGRVPRIDSCGTSRYHIGSSPDPRTMQTLRSHGITNYKHAARQLSDSDFEEFDYILCMDRENLRDIERRKPEGAKARVGMFGEWAVGEGQKARVVEDPYYGGEDGFEDNYGLLVRCTQGFLKRELGVETE